MEPNTTAGHPRRWAILGVLVVSLLVVVLDNTVLNVALRTIADPRHGLGASQSDLEWAVNGYTLVFAGLLMTWGILGDRYGRRRTLLLGMALFGLASLASAYSQNPAQLIAARAVMGVGGAAVLPTTLSIISTVFHPKERARAIAIWAGTVGLAAAVGPVLAGLLLEHFWWGSVFLINVPIIVAGLTAMLILVPESKAVTTGRLDLVGVALTIVGSVALVYGIIDGGNHGFGRSVAWGSIVAGLAVLAIFVWYESRVANPSVDVRLFRNPHFAAAVGTTGLIFFAAWGMMFGTAFYLQLVRGFSPLRTGTLFLPFAAAQIIFAPRSAALVRRYGPKLVTAAGLVVAAAGLAPLALVTARTPAWVLAASFFVQGLGMSNVIPPTTESIMSTLPREKAGVGSAVGNTIRQIGGALGIAIVGSILSAMYQNRMAGAVTGLPRAAATAARQSVAGGYAVAGALGPRGAALIRSANAAFLPAMHTAAVVSVLVALVGVAVVLVWLPRRSAPHAGAAAAAPAGRGADAVTRAGVRPAAVPVGIARADDVRADDVPEAVELAGTL